MKSSIKQYNIIQRYYLTGPPVVEDDEVESTTNVYILYFIAGDNSTVYHAVLAGGF